MARAEAPDGSAWVEYFPIEIFYWLEPRNPNVGAGGGPTWQRMEPAGR